MKLIRCLFFGGLLFGLGGCQERPPLQQVQLTFPLWVKQERALEKAFEKDGISLKINVKSERSPSGAHVSIVKSFEEMSRLSLPLSWFEDEGKLTLEAEVEWRTGQEEATIRFFGQVVLDLDSFSEKGKTQIEVFLQEQATD